MYSQRDEEEVILKHLGPTGRFCDIGAYSFTSFSNTRALAERGWSGTLVEPCPDACNTLIQQTAGFKDIEIVNAVIVPQYYQAVGGLVEFHASPNALSTVQEKHMKLWAEHPGVSFRRIWSPCITIHQLLRQLPGPYSFVTIDAEGVSFDILQCMDLKEMGCEVVCIEIDQYETAIRDHLLCRGYSVIHKTAENIIAKRS